MILLYFTLLGLPSTCTIKYNVYIYHSKVHINNKPRITQKVKKTYFHCGPQEVQYLWNIEFINGQCSYSLPL